MSPKSEILLHQCFWMADVLLRPTWRNLEGSFEEWCYRRGFLRQVQRLEAEGWIESRQGPDGTGRVRRLTRKGLLRALGGTHPEERWDREWDGLWRMVVFDVPERKRSLRNHLRRVLRDSGFGLLQGSVWIRPDPLGPAADDLRKVAAECGVMTFWEARPCAGETNDDLAGAAWDFAALGLLHKQYLEHLKTVPSGGEDHAADLVLDWSKREYELWGECMRMDPLLPRVLWPRNYLGEKAWKGKLRALAKAREVANETIRYR